MHALNGTLNKDLATALGVTGGTLHKHWDNIFNNLGSTVRMRRAAHSWA